MSPQRRLRIAIIGAGKVGSALGKVLAENGEGVVAIISRTASSARRAGRWIGCRRTSASLSDLPPKVDLIVITTPHAAVEEVARSLAQLPGRDFRKTACCHASGMLTADALQPLRDRGATVFSFHPLQTFPRNFPVRKIVPSVRGIYYGVDGPPRGIRFARLLARKLDGSVLLVPPERREFYHAACVVASNHLTALLAILEAMHREIDPGARPFYPVYRPIIEATLRNIAHAGPAEALSGPVARGGVDTVAAHFRALGETLPAVIPYYARLSMETVRLANAKESLTASQIHDLIQLIVPFLTESSSPEESQ